MSKRAVIIDTNIVFKAQRLKNSAIRDVLTNTQYQFYVPKFLIVEIFKHVEMFKHKEKLLRNNAQLEDELYEYPNGLLQRITFVNEGTISIGNYVEAYRLYTGIDEKDVPFVALALELDCSLWTHDQPIKEGLTSRGFTSFFDSRQ